MAVFSMRKHPLVAGGSAAIPCHSALLPRGGGLGVLQPRTPWGATGRGGDPARAPWGSGARVGCSALGVRTLPCVLQARSGGHGAGADPE